MLKSTFGPDAIGSITTTKADATSSIDAAAIIGIAEVEWALTTNTTVTFITGVQRKTTLNLMGGNCLAPAHPVGGFDRLIVIGTGTCDYSFIHESKLELLTTGTIVNYVSFYKPSIDEIKGNITNFVLFDADVSLAGIEGTVTNKHSLYSPADDFLMIQKGGIQANAKLLLDDYTATKHDSGNVLLVYKATDINITIPSTLPIGTRIRFVQGLGGKGVFLASGGNNILNVSSHTKTGGLFSVCDIDVITNGTGGATILSGLTSA